MDRKKISLSIPCYNEELNIKLMVEKVKQLFLEDELKSYEYSLEFIDNNSTDKTREQILMACVDDKEHVKAIFNSRNFGGVSSYYGLLQTEGDCSIVLPCDFQIPLEIIKKLILKWEQGSKIVCAVKKGSKTNKFMWFIRSLYYKLIKRFSDIEQIQHFTGSGLYDKSFVQVLRNLDDPIPSLRGIVAELGYQIDQVEYLEQKRHSGKSKQNLNSLFNIAMRNMITYTKLFPRLATILGFIISFISVIIGVGYVLLKFIYWDQITFGTAPLIFGVYFLGGVQLCFLGFIGEYLMIINFRMLNRPLVIEEKRVNFNLDKDNKGKL